MGREGEGACRGREEQVPSRGLWRRYHGRQSQGSEHLGGEPGNIPQKGTASAKTLRPWPPPDVLKELGDQWLEWLGESSDLGSEQWSGVESKSWRVTAGERGVKISWWQRLALVWGS